MRKPKGVKTMIWTKKKKRKIKRKYRRAIMKWLIESVKKHLTTTLQPSIMFFQAEDGILDYKVTGVQTCALPILVERGTSEAAYCSSVVIPGRSCRGTRSKISRSKCTPYVQRPMVRQLMSWSTWMPYISSLGRPATVETMFLLGRAAVAPSDSAAPVPTEIRSKLSSPVSQLKQ